MPPQGRKRKSSMSDSASDALNDFPAPPRTIPTKDAAHITTPDGSPATKKRCFNSEQREQLVENLRIEIAQRANDMRSQYKSQANTLRQRLENRVNRIPARLRNANMGDLLAQYTKEKQPQLPSSADPEKCSATLSNQAKPNTAATTKTVKASASHASAKRKQPLGPNVLEDKENASEADAFGRHQGQSQTSSRQLDPSQILSPKSNNSRPLAHATVKPMSPVKSNIARPVSPIKAMPAAAMATTASQAAKTAGKAKPKTAAVKRTASKQTKAATVSSAAGAPKPKRAAAASAESKMAQDRAPSRNSNSSEGTISSTGTTIVRSRQTAATKTTAAATTKKKAGAGVVKKTTTAAAAKVKKAAADTTAAATGTVKGGRTLRKR